LLENYKDIQTHPDLYGKVECYKSFIYLLTYKLLTHCSAVYPFLAALHQFCFSFCCILTTGPWLSPPFENSWIRPFEPLHLQYLITVINYYFEVVQKGN